MRPGGLPCVCSLTDTLLSKQGHSQHGGQSAKNSGLQAVAADCGLLPLSCCLLHHYWSAATGVLQVLDRCQQHAGSVQLSLCNLLARRPLTAAVAAAGRGDFVLDGVPRMRERPIADLVSGLQQLGVSVSCPSGTGCPPVHISARGLPCGEVSSLLYPDRLLC